MGKRVHSSLGLAVTKSKGVLRFLNLLIRNDFIVTDNHDERPLGFFDRETGRLDLGRHYRGFPHKNGNDLVWCFRI